MDCEREPRVLGVRLGTFLVLLLAIVRGVRVVGSMAGVWAGVNAAAWEGSLVAWAGIGLWTEGAAGTGVGKLAGRVAGWLLRDGI